MNRTSSYEQFARFYEAFWSADWARNIEKGVTRILKRSLPRKKKLRILDVACGGGHVAQMLTGNGHAVVGVDGSRTLLRLARKTASDARFRLWQFGKPLQKIGMFDAAVCLYDSINHATDERMVRHVFASIAEALMPGAVLLFDYNSVTGFARRWHFAMRVERDWGWCESVFSYDAKKQRGIMRTRGAVRRGRKWRRFTEVYTEMPFRKGEVARWLRAAGLTIEPIPDSIMRALPLDPGRVWVLARKRVAPASSR